MKQRGLTLIELLLATALTAMLMLGVLMVLATLRKPTVSASGEGEAVASIDPLVGAFEVLRADLQQAKSIEWTEDGLTMISDAGVHDQSFERSARPVRVSYRTLSIGESRWLIREQSALDTVEPMAGTRSLVAYSIDRVELIAPEPWPDPSELGSDANQLPVAAKRPTLGAWRLRLFSAGLEEPVLDRAVMLQWSLVDETIVQ